MAIIKEIVRPLNVLTSNENDRDFFLIDFAYTCLATYVCKYVRTKQISVITQWIEDFLSDSESVNHLL